MAIEYAPQAFSAGYIALSYIISFIGSLSTVELLQRRTSRRGMYNWYLLAGSSLTMGGVAIWAMHYIGNCAIILYPGFDEQNKLQLIYSPGYTTVGMFAGLSICGMHYLGQAGIYNYKPTYVPGHVVGSVVIAVVATTIALTLFFILRKNFTNSWYKRVLCAIILSGAVSGMHWTAALGTVYQVNTEAGNRFGHDTRHMTVVITIVMSVVSCFLMLFFAIGVKRARAQKYNRAQKIVLASATFDPLGRLMVLPDGILPTKEITDAFREKSLEEGFDKSHAIFQWIYRTTRHWNSLNGLLEGMKAHVQQYNSQTHSTDYVEDYGFIFREQFCVAAQDLADGTHRSLDKMGFLYDEIIVTGGTSLAKKHTDLEASHGKGKFLFLVNEVTKSDAVRLAAHGFRFTSPSNVAENIARSMQVTKETITTHMNTMKHCASAEYELHPGVYIGCFAVRANVKGSFDVLVRANARNQLPTVKLPITTLEQTQLHYLQEQENKTAMQIISGSQALRRPESGGTLDVSPFVIMFHDALRELINEIQDPFFADATLVLTPIPIPYLDLNKNETGTAHIITFKTMVPIHSRTITNNTAFEFVSLPFFSLQQRCYPFSPDHAIHARRTHREFSARIAHVPKISQPMRAKFANTLTPWQKGPTITATTLSSRASSSSEKNLVLEYPTGNPFLNGGIMVSQSVSVEHDEAKGEGNIEMRAMGPSTAVVKEEDIEQPTWADTLFREAIAAGNARRS
ncbi:uncharacterized protein LAJ45_05392 [Morchella importuna]|uniref:uncharacterized protein n=1 Tax=Morchella importuna TaxID=1174673 RepID=UPI001E8E0FC7|nr:uncharacterized protein LAJ45_05392 [Morchella importuna]KAH8150696.1 hypothetical protein LAJ45_05392 [Morchella importuna]